MSAQAVPTSRATVRPATTRIAGVSGNRVQRYQRHSTRAGAAADRLLRRGHCFRVHRRFDVEVLDHVRDVSDYPT